MDYSASDDAKGTSYSSTHSQDLGVALFDDLEADCPVLVRPLVNTRETSLDYWVRLIHNISELVILRVNFGGFCELGIE